MGFKEDIERLEAQRRHGTSNQEQTNAAWLEEARIQTEANELARVLASEFTRTIDEPLITSKLRELRDELNCVAENELNVWNLVSVKGLAIKHMYAAPGYDGDSNWGGNDDYDPPSIEYYGFALAREMMNLPHFAALHGGTNYSFENPVEEPEPKSFLGRLLKPQPSTRLVTTDYLLIFAGNVGDKGMVMPAIGMNTYDGSIILGRHFYDYRSNYPRSIVIDVYDYLEGKLEHGSNSLLDIDNSLLKCVKELPEYNI